MKPRPAPVHRRFLVALALASALLTLPAAGGWFREILHFYAGFDTAMSAGPGGSSSGISALGGEIFLSGTPGVFTVDLGDGDEGGVLAISENPFLLPAVLTASLDDPVEESEIDVSMSLVALGGSSPLVIALLDDDAGGILDLEYDDGGSISVGGIADTLDLSDPDQGMQLRFVLREPSMGPKTWKLVLQGAFGVRTYQGLLLTPGPLRLGMLQITRPGQSTDGRWELDDLLVSSPFGSGSNSQ